MEKITPSHSLPQTEVTFEAYKFQSLHRIIMDAATRWAKTEVYDYGHEYRATANAYIVALTLVMAGAVPDEVFDSIFMEYRSLLFGKELSHAKNQR